jgi:hypothetical protein
VPKKLLVYAAPVLCIFLVAGCAAKKQRTQILENQERMMNQQEKILDNQNTSATSDKEFQTAVRQDLGSLLQSAKTTNDNDQKILTLVQDTNTRVSTDITKSLDQIYKEVYGVGTDLRMAVGETRIVVAVNNDRPLKVHGEIPSGAGAENVVTRLPIGSLIFNCQKVTDYWWKGAIIQDEQKTEVFFAVKYTEPLRDTLSPSLTGTETEVKTGKEGAGGQ